MGQQPATETQYSAQLPMIILICIDYADGFHNAVILPMYADLPADKQQCNSILILKDTCKPDLFFNASMKGRHTPSCRASHCRISQSSYNTQVLLCLTFAFVGVLVTHDLCPLESSILCKGLGQNVIIDLIAHVTHKYPEIIFSPF